MSETEKVREELLVLRCQLGDEAAFRDLVDLMEDRLFYYVRRLLQDEATAYDVLQEVWITVFRKIHRLRDAKMFRVWVYRIAHDKAVTIIRHELTREHAEAEFNNDTLLQNSEADFAVEDAGRISGLMNQLSPSHREVLTLFFLEDMPYEQIALVTCSSIGTVKSRLYYAKRSLRRLLEVSRDE